MSVKDRILEKEKGLRGQKGWNWIEKDVTELSQSSQVIRGKHLLTSVFVGQTSHAGWSRAHARYCLRCW